MAVGTTRQIFDKLQTATGIDSPITALNTKLNTYLNSTTGKMHLLMNDVIAWDTAHEHILTTKGFTPAKADIVADKDNHIKTYSNNARTKADTAVVLEYTKYISNAHLAKALPGWYADADKKATIDLMADPTVVALLH